MNCILGEVEHRLWHVASLPARFLFSIKVLVEAISDLSWQITNAPAHHFNCTRSYSEDFEKTEVVGPSEFLTQQCQTASLFFALRSMYIHKRVHITHLIEHNLASNQIRKQRCVTSVATIYLQRRVKIMKSNKHNIFQLICFVLFRLNAGHS